MNAILKRERHVSVAILAQACIPPLRFALIVVLMRGKYTLGNVVATQSHSAELSANDVRSWTNHSDRRARQRQKLQAAVSVRVLPAITETNSS